jgi:hypothetical protein
LFSLISYSTIRLIRMASIHNFLSNNNNKCYHRIRSHNYLKLFLFFLLIYELFNFYQPFNWLINTCHKCLSLKTYDILLFSRLVDWNLLSSLKKESHHFSAITLIYFKTNHNNRYLWLVSLYFVNFDYFWNLFTDLSQKSSSHELI